MRLRAPVVQLVPQSSLSEVSGAGPREMDRRAASSHARRPLFPCRLYVALGAALARRVLATRGHNALFRAAGRVLLEFGERRLRATVGATLVLHTWTRALVFHPHVHAIVTGGGLALDNTTWKASSRAFLFPIKAMARALRGKMIDALKEAHDQ